MIYSEVVTVAADGSWTTKPDSDLSAPAGTKMTVTVTFTDAAGNTAVSDLSYFVDYQAPENAEFKVNSADGELLIYPPLGLGDDPTGGNGSVNPSMVVEFTHPTAGAQTVVVTYDLDTQQWRDTSNSQYALVDPFEGTVSLLTSDLQPGTQVTAYAFDEVPDGGLVNGEPNGNYSITTLSVPVDGFSTADAGTGSAAVASVDGSESAGILSLNDVFATTDTAQPAAAAPVQDSAGSAAPTPYVAYGINDELSPATGSNPVI